MKMATYCIRKFAKRNKFMKNSQTQIIATIGPISATQEVLSSMVKNKLDVARLNFSWGDLKFKKETISLIRKLSKDHNRIIPIIADLPGPRIQKSSGHTFDHNSISSITERDKEDIKFAVENNLEYIALSFVARAEDVLKCRELIKEFSGKQRIIAKIERKEALENIEEIIKSADAVMVARGDLGNEIPIEEIPFVQQKIIELAKKLGKPVIVATQMLSTMVENDTPTRAEVTDVETAVMEGADAVMLSEETAMGKHPIEVIEIMERLIVEAEKHMNPTALFNHL